MTVGMLLATILLVLTFSGVLSGAWERLGIRQRTAGAWLLAMLAALLMPDVRLGAARVNPAGLAVTAAASVRLMMTIRPRRELVRVLLGSVIAGAMGLLVLILSDGQADALWACAMLIGAAACFLGVSRRGMLLCSLMGLLVAQGAAGVSGVLRADVQPWTDAALVRDLREGLANQGAALVTVNPEQADFPLTVAQDEISNAAEYDTLLSGEKAAKIRLIVRRGGDNEALMKNFALSVKAGLDHTAPTLIRDVYFAANAQEPLRMLWGARETEPIRLQNTILPLAQVISNALEPRDTAGGISGSEDVPEHSAVTGLIFAGGLLLAGVVGYGLLLTGGRRHGKKT